jgi:hypothetical protein
MRREAGGCASLSNNKSRVANHLTTSQGGENKPVQSDQPVHRYAANSATLLAQEALPVGNLSLGTKPLAKSRPTLGPHPGSARLGRQLGTRQTWPALSRPIPPFPAISRLRAEIFRYWVADSSAVGGARWGTDPAPREGAENPEAVANNQDGEPRDPAEVGWQAVDESDSYFRDHF